jgi:hypothetical protein
MEHCFGDGRIFWLPPSDWSILLTAVAIAGMLILFV